MKKLIMALAATTVLAGPAVADEVRTQSFMWGDTWTVAYDAGYCGTNAMDGNGNHVCSLGWLLKNGGWSKDGADAAISNKDARAAYNEYLAAQDDAEEVMQEMKMDAPVVIERPVVPVQPLPMPEAPVAPTPAPVAPAPVTPPAMDMPAAPSNPAPSNPAPSNPAPSNPAPSNPAPSNPAPSNPAPSNPAPVTPPAMDMPAAPTTPDDNDFGPDQDFTS